MKRNSFNYNEYSPVHRRQSHRRVLKKFIQILGVVGWLLLFIQLVFMVMWMFADSFDRPRLFKLAAIYLVLGVATFTVRALLSWLRDVKSSRRRLRRHSLAGPVRPAADDMDALDSALAPDEEGSALVMVLVIAALLSGLVLQAQVSARLAHRLEGAQLTAVRLRLAATDAVRAALRILAEDPDLRTDHLEETWAQPWEEVDPSGITVRVQTVDLNRFFDLNNLSLPVRPSVRPAAAAVADLLSLCGDLSPYSRADALQDWLDDDDEGFHEAAYYREREQPCAPPNRALYAWNELTWVDGFRREDFARTIRSDVEARFRGSLAECLTLVPAPRDSVIPVNLNTAAEETLLGVVGLANDGLVRRIVARRRLRPLQQADAMALAIDPDLIEQLAPYVAVRSTWFRIQALAYLGGDSESIEAVARRDDNGTVEVVQWAL